jgi:hypothetical protein
MGECKNHQACMDKIDEKISGKLDRNWFTWLIVIIVTLISSFFTYTNMNIKDASESINDIKISMTALKVEQSYIKKAIEDKKP